ncbi:MAG: hypothetical protein ACI4UM_01940 [Succinivibrio sp.]
MNQDKFRRRTYTLRIGLLMMFFFMVLGAFFLSGVPNYPYSMDRKFIDENRRAVLRQELIDSRTNMQMSEKIKSVEYIRKNNIPDNFDKPKESEQHSYQESTARLRGEQIISEREESELKKEKVSPANNSKLKSKSMSDYWKSMQRN